MNKIFVLTTVTVMMLINGCSTRGTGVYKKNSVSVEEYTPIMDKKKYTHPTMKPYEIMDIKYYPAVVKVGDKFNGNASWYGPNFHGKLTSNGETYDMMDMTAAHKTMPMNTILKVTNNNNGLTTHVRINDRGPFVGTRIIDLSKAAAKKIDMIGAGTASITIEVLGFASKKDVSKVSSLKKAASVKVTNDFCLQIASFSNIDGAIKIQEKYNGTDGYKTIIKDVESNNGRIFKVLLDGFDSRQEIIDYKEKKIFKHSFIVKKD